MESKLCLECSKVISKFNKFCGNSCASKFNNRNRVRTKITKEKIAVSLRKFRGTHEDFLRHKAILDNPLIDSIISEICLSEKSMRKAAVKVGLPFSTFRRKAELVGCYKSSQGLKGSIKSAKTLEDIFSGKVDITSGQLRVRLIKEGLKKLECEDCKITDSYNGKPIVLELDHINGNNSNNSFENLRILCPNCHSQTPTFRGRKIKI